jgi:hypothetical protein
MLKSLRHLRPFIITVLLLVILLAGFAWLRAFQQDVHPLTDTPLTPLAAFRENDVQVDIVLEKDPSGRAWLAGTFTPTREHFHLYSKDLPKGGLQGQGRPTLLEIISPSQVTPIGALMASLPPEGHYTPVRGQALPVYPEGPVTLRLQIELPVSGGPVRTELSVTYMACDKDICLTPVMDKRVSVVIP